jgi:hypothetical protein
VQSCSIFLEVSRKLAHLKFCTSVWLCHAGSYRTPTACIVVWCVLTIHVWFFDHLGFLVVFFFGFLGWGWDWVYLVRRPLIGLLYQPRMIDDECGAVIGMTIGRGNRSTRRKSAPVPLCPPQIPHHLTRPRTRAATVGSQRVTTWAMARPSWFLLAWLTVKKGIHIVDGRSPSGRITAEIMIAGRRTIQSSASLNWLRRFSLYVQVLLLLKLSSITGSVFRIWIREDELKPGKTSLGVLRHVTSIA